MHTSARPAVQPLLRKALAGAKILSADREHELLRRYHHSEDRAAMDELVRSHMPIIFRAAGRNARNPGVDINDLVQTATEGLLIAINRWSFEKSAASGARFANDDTEVVPAHGSRLATYAMWWMRIMLTDAVIEGRGVVLRAKRPKVRQALFRLPAAMNALDIRLPLTDRDVDRLATHIGTGAQDIEEALVHAAGDVYLDEPVGDGGMLRGDLIAEEHAEGEEGILHRLVSTDRWERVCDILMSLSPRDRFILLTRYYMTPKWKLGPLSTLLNLSRERIRQIGLDGLMVIRDALKVRQPCRHPGASARIDALADAIARHSGSEPAILQQFLWEQGIIADAAMSGRRRRLTAM